LIAGLLDRHRFAVHSARRRDLAAPEAGDHFEVGIGAFFAGLAQFVDRALASAHMTREIPACPNPDGRRRCSDEVRIEGTKSLELVEGAAGSPGEVREGLVREVSVLFLESEELFDQVHS
jgi:hypothetical protein